MRRLTLTLAAVLISTSAWAMHCPQDMARIDAQLSSNPPSDPAVLAQVQKLRAEGETLHNAGKHEESIQVLEQAQSLLDEHKN